MHNSSSRKTTNAKIGVNSPLLSQIHRLFMSFMHMDIILVWIWTVCVGTNGIINEGNCERNKNKFMVWNTVVNLDLKNENNHSNESKPLTKWDLHIGKTVRAPKQTRIVLRQLRFLASFDHIMALLKFYQFSRDTTSIISTSFPRCWHMQYLFSYWMPFAFFMYYQEE